MDYMVIECLEPLDLARIFIVFVGHEVRDFFNREKREIKHRENKYQWVSLKKESGRKIDQGLTISSWKLSGL